MYRIRVGGSERYRVYFVGFQRYLATNRTQNTFPLKSSVPPFPVDPVDLDESEAAAEENAKPENEEDSTNVVQAKLAHLHHKRFYFFRLSVKSSGG